MVKELPPTKARLRVLTLASQDQWHPYGPGEWILTDRLRNAGLLTSYQHRHFPTEAGKKWLVRHG